MWLHFPLHGGSAMLLAFDGRTTTVSRLPIVPPVAKMTPLLVLPVPSFSSTDPGAWIGAVGEADGTTIAAEGADVGSST